MNWIENSDESEINANMTMTKGVTNHPKIKNVKIRNKDAPHHQIVPASTEVSGYSTFLHLNTPYSVSSKRKLKEKTHFTEINRDRVTDVNQSSSFKPWIPYPRREMAPVPLNLGVRQWPGGHSHSRMTHVTTLPSFLHRLAVSPTFGHHHHLVSGLALSRQTGPFLHTPYFVQNRNGPVIQHFQLYG